MILASTLFVAALAPLAGGKCEVQVALPKAYVEGGSYPAHIEIKAPSDGADLPAWALSAAAFTVNGKALKGERSAAKIELAPGQKIVVDIDLASALAEAKLTGPFQIAYAKEIHETAPTEVTYMQAAEKGLDFMKMEPAELAKYHVLMTTNRGEMEMEFWPDVAPGHVRNFLDLCYTGFYNGITFHRVIPGFMIQGGDPTGTGTGSGPRKLKAEFSKDKKHTHVPGVLSMARSSDPDSASCQFFVMHQTSPHLDGQYSAFGKLVSGLETVEKIVQSKKGPGDKPLEPQTILKAVVIKVGK